MLSPYEKIGWVDHIVDDESGEVIQEGTPISERNLNHMDDGIAAVTEAVRTLETQFERNVHVSFDEPENWKEGEWWYRTLRTREVSQNPSGSSMEIPLSTSAYDPSREYFMIIDGNPETLENADNGDFIVDIQ